MLLSGYSDTGADAEACGFARPVVYPESKAFKTPIPHLLFTPITGSLLPSGEFRRGGAFVFGPMTGTFPP